MINKLATWTLGACLLATTSAWAIPADSEMAPSDRQLAAMYWQGHELLKKSDWSGAVERFRQLETSLREKEPASADAAIYWQAYALLQARRTTEAKATLEKFHRDYPESRWSKDSDSLLRQIESGSKAATTTPADDEELAEVAVTGLMQAPPERAIPILRKVLKGSHSLEVKKRALFVLSQLDDTAALDVLGEVASGSSDSGLREEAIRMLGVSGEDEAIERLQGIYATSRSSEDKRSIIQAWLIADRPKLVMQAARNETDQELRRSAIEALGAMDATTELKALFDSEQLLENRKTILQSLGVAGDSGALAAIAESTQPDEIRVQAIQALGIADGEESGAALVRIYTSAKSAEIRDAALQGMMIAGDSESMLKLYRQARSSEEKQALLRMLTLTDSDSTLDLIESELDNGSKQP
jgi:HEAT repeat protein